MQKIDQLEQFDELLEKKSPFFLLKHSLTCPISQAAYREYQNFAEGHTEIPSYYLTVQEARPLSNTITEKFQIKHESPQAILFINGLPVWNTSHWKITNHSLTNALNEYA